MLNHIPFPSFPPALTSRTHSFHAIHLGIPLCTNKTSNLTFEAAYANLLLGRDLINLDSCRVKLSKGESIKFVHKMSVIVVGLHILSMFFYFFGNLKFVCIVKTV
uniref:Uncharacterized protein n=1 Tax=Spongospora subterranea TaxID=70186 RepID=A0A0H5R5Q4_9EUKA|eukprot:CRZ03529.1 hypothetical protein [Spongospora subterranea]